jgi:hypothetical protein
MAVAGQAFQSTVTLTGVAFALGDVVKCVADVWSEHTSADVGALLVGVVTMVSGSTCTVTMAGERQDAFSGGTPGQLYWVPDAAGNSSTAPSTTGMQRCMERQITATTRLVLPDALSWFAVQVETCDSGVATEHDFAYYLNNT